MTTTHRARRLILLLQIVLLPLLPLVLTGSAPAAGPALATDPARILATIRDFSEFPDGTPKSRYCYRTEMDAAQEDLAGRFAEALGARGTASLWAFAPKHAADNWDTTGVVPQRTMFRNVTALLPGDQPGRGKFLITAHFDAIGTRTAGWTPWLDPAPGADDDMSGTAAVLELARVLAQDPTYPFDIEFICFDGEELGLWGSEAYAAAEAADPLSTPILGVLNMDMIGYNPEQDSLVIMSNRPSLFLSRYMVESERLADHDPTFRIDSSVNNLFISDQGPFWEYGIPGVLMIENIRVVLHNPHYHKVTDRAETLSRNGMMIARTADVILKTLRRLAADADGPPRIVTNDTELIYYVNRVIEPRTAVPGDSILVVAGFMNTGGPAASPGPARIYKVVNGARQLIATRPLAGPIPTGGHVTVSVDLVVEPGDVGAITIVAEAGEGAARSEARTAIPVRGATTRVARHHVEPNPVRDPGSARIAYELTGDATVRVSVLDLHGHELGTETYLFSGIRQEPGENAGPGLQKVALRNLLGGETAPGIYLYRIEVFPDGGGGGDTTVGKFAILR